MFGFSSDKRISTHPFWNTEVVHVIREAGDALEEEKYEYIWR